jgi:mRNA-degrading endonuclease toxin of MazEF toxin-antitoxin module
MRPDPTPVLTAVDPQRLGDFAGRLDPDELTEINVALRAVLDLD